MSQRRLQIMCLAFGGLAACAPLIRFGEIEPAPGTRTLIDVEVRPKQDEGVSPAELAAAVSDTTIGVLVTAPQPVVGAGEVRDEIASNVQGLSVDADDALVDEAELATDARRLESIYMARGFFRAKNLGHTIVVRGKDRAAVEFDIREGFATTVSEIRFRGACELIEDDSDPEKTTRLRTLCAEVPVLLPLRVGDVWTENAYATGLDVLSRAFRSAGFLHARVVGDNWVSRDRGEAAVWYDIESGPLVRVTGEVLVEGNVHVGLHRIRRRIEIQEGDVIDDALLRRTEQNIQELGPFFSVQAAVVRDGFVEAPDVPPPDLELAPEVPGDDPALAPEKPHPSEQPPDEQRRRGALPERMQVKVQVAEAPRWELTVGPGVVTDFKRLDLALPLSFTHRNLFGEVASLQAQARPALVLPNCFTSNTGCFDSPGFGLDAKLGLQVPSFFEEYLRLAVDATYKRDPSQEGTSQEVGGSVGLSRRLFHGLTARLGYNVAFLNYFGSSALAGLTEDDESVLIRDAGLRFKAQDFLAWFDVALLLDLRDSPLDTRNGFFTSLSMNLAAAYSGSDVPYTRLLGDVRGYWTPRFLKWLTLAARVKLGANLFEASHGTPQPARFKSGGATSMRGFATDRLGDFVCKDKGDTSYLNNPDCGDSSTDRTYIGGNFVIESNFELRFHLRGGLGLVVFADVGRVWSVGGLRLDDLFVAIGPGFRYDLPVGPIRLDVGLLLGRERANEWHFSLGQAF